MPNSNDCSQRDFSEYDVMSTQELQQLLREDASKSEGEESDTAAILYAMQVLARRERETHQRKTPEEALKTFKEQYDTEKLLISEEKTEKSHKGSMPVWKRCIAAILVLVVVVAGATVTAKAFGVDLLKIVAKWTEDTFHFDYAGQTEDGGVQQEDDLLYSSLRDALDMVDMDLRIPTWLPDVYTMAAMDIKQTPVQRGINAFYQKGEASIQIHIVSFSDTASSYIVKDDTPVEIYQANGMTYYIFGNTNILQAAWIDGKYECHIFGTLSLEELKCMLDSVRKG